MKRILTGFAFIAVLLLFVQCNKEVEETAGDENMIIELVRAGVMDNETNPVVSATNREITEPINPPATSTTTTTMSASVSGRQTAGSGAGQVVSEEVLQPGAQTQTPVVRTTTTTAAAQVIEMQTRATPQVTAQPVEPVVQQPASRDVGAAGTQTTVVSGQGVTVIQQTTIIQGNTVGTGNTYPNGCYIKVGRDETIEAAAPRQYTKITMAVFNTTQNAYYVDFQIYAIPAGSALQRTGANMIGYAYNIELINGQAQMTKYWNGKNVYGQFLSQGNYNIYLYYKIKDANGKVLKTDGRYWGNSRSFYIKLS